MANHGSPHPDDVFHQLTIGAKSPRTVKSLDIIHRVCKEQYERGCIDFNYESIGRLSEAKGGPKAQPIRNSTGAFYRALIDSWSGFASSKTTTASQPRPNGLDYDVLSMITDPVARVLVQSYISEKNKLRYENQLLKVAARGKVVIDLSGKTKSTHGAMEVVMPAGLLLQQERSALIDAISPENIRKQGWTINEQMGSVSRGPLPVFSPGFIGAIRKILEDTDEN